jgi:hypothetical protein
LPAAIQKFATAHLHEARCGVPPPFSRHTIELPRSHWQNHRVIISHQLPRHYSRFLHLSDSVGVSLMAIGHAHNSGDNDNGEVPRLRFRKKRRDLLGWVRNVSTLI